jgi:hypothetical protein
VTKGRPYRGRKAPPVKLTTAPQGADLLGKAARSLYGDDAPPALLSLALMEAMLSEAAAISDPNERQATLNIIHMRAYEAAHGPQS